MEWLSSNAMWVFSGFGVAIPLAIAGLFFSRQNKKNSQTQKGGKGSINIQSGGSTRIDVGGSHE